MFKVTVILLLRLVMPALLVAGTVSTPYAYADGGDSDGGGDSGDSEGGESDGGSGGDSSGDSGGNSGSGGDSSGADSSGSGPGGSSSDGDGDEDKGGRSRINEHIDGLGQQKSSKSHQRTIRSAVQQNKILPLGTIKRIVKNKTRSEIINIDLERKRGSWVYEFKVVDPRGRLLEIYVDATNGNILRTKHYSKQED